MRFLELLAPARNADIGIAAIDCGADAVYIAGPAFGARKDAGNEVSEIRRLCDYAHQFGARVFVTVNTIIYDSELDEVSNLVSEVRDAGADGIIAQDLALLKICSSGADSAGISKLPSTHAAPTADPADASSGSAEASRCADIGSGETPQRVLPLLASTQCSVRTAQKAAELESLGFSRITLERELSLEQIRTIADAVGCEVECFVHGALCVCYSGQCYLSEFLDGRSANRGACVQACRSRYDVLDKNGRVLVRDKAVLSLRDLNLLSRLSDLAEAGVTSFKIEGRLKNISYVRNVVRAYSLALDSLVAHSGGRFARASFGTVRKGFTPDVNRTFNRGYTSLFLDGVSHGGEGRGAARGDARGDTREAGQNSAQRVAAMDAAKAMGERLGRVSALSRDFRSFRIETSKGDVRGPKDGGSQVRGGSKSGPRGTRGLGGGSKDYGGVKLSNGDGLAFVSRDGEVIGLRANVVEGNLVKCKSVPELYDGATIFRNYDIAFEREMAANPCVRMLSVTVSAEFAVSEDRKDDAPVSSETIKNCAEASAYGRKCANSTVTMGNGALKVTAQSEDGRRVEKTYTDLWNDYAENTARMLSMWQTQMSKTSGIFAFTPDGPLTTSNSDTIQSAPNNPAPLSSVTKPTSLERPAVSAPTVLPLLSASAMNFIRADIAAALAALPCGTRPPHINPSASGFSETAEPTAKPQTITYKDNVANKIAEEIYAAANLPVSESAYELTHRPAAELMRTKYCLRRELNLCPRHSSTTFNTKTSSRTATPSSALHSADPLHLLNNGRRLTALFDCHHCEMVIKSE